MNNHSIAQKYVNYHGYSDIEPFEIVKVISDKTIEIRPMKATLDPNWKPEFITGGFSGHCVNIYDQKWIIESIEDAPSFRIRRKKNGKGWTKNGRYKLADQPHKFYDYNF